MNKKKNKKRQQGNDEEYYCCLHPSWEVAVGVCAHCLKDRLLLLLASSTTKQQVLALGSSFLQRLDSSSSSRHHHRPNYYSDDDSAAASPDDSFISIKFEDNGKATWDMKMKQQEARQTTTAVVVAEHVSSSKSSTRWRKHVVGRLLQLARWNNKSKTKQPAAGEKMRSNNSKQGIRWIRTLTLTRRRSSVPADHRPHHL